MDSITQAALGGVVGELTLGRKLGWKGAGWGLFFGILPDLDILFYPFLDEVGKLKWHRGLSHSILVMILASLICAKPLARLHRNQGVSPRRAGWFVFFVWSTHVLIDVFTTYGTQVFEPFSDHRVAWSNLFIIDPLFTIPLLLCLLAWPLRSFRFLRERREWKREGADPDEEPEFPEFSKRPAAIALSLSSLYVLFSLIMKSWAASQIEDQIKDTVQGGRLVAVAPSPFNTILWRGLIENEQGFFVTHWSPFDKGTPEFHYFPKHHELATQFEGKALFEGLKWFSRGRWIARPAEDGKVVFIDMRFGEVRDYSKKTLTPFFQWHMDYDDNGRMVAPAYRPRDLEWQRTLIELGKRLLGRRREWEEFKSF